MSKYRNSRRGRATANGMPRRDATFLPIIARGHCSEAGRPVLTIVTDVVSKAVVGWSLAWPDDRPTVPATTTAH